VGPYSRHRNQDPDTQCGHGQRVRSEDRLPAERLPEQDAEKRDIAGSRGLRQAHARGFGESPPRQRKREEWKHLQRVQTDEMRHAQVAVLGAPARSRELRTRITVRRAHRVRTHNCHALSGARAG
jgi:hypothetical protein